MDHNQTQITNEEKEGEEERERCDFCEEDIKRKQIVCVRWVSVK